MYKVAFKRGDTVNAFTRPFERRLAPGCPVIVKGYNDNCVMAVEAGGNRLPRKFAFKSFTFEVVKKCKVTPGKKAVKNAAE